MSEEFKRRYRAAVSQNNAAKRRNRYRKKGKWDKYSPGGVVKYPNQKGNRDDEDHGVHPPPSGEGGDAATSG